MNAKIILRNVVSTDARSIFHLGHSSFLWPSESILWEEQLVRWYCDNATSLSFVAEHDSVIVGVILCHTQDKLGYVGWIAVDSQWRRQGIGRQLMERALMAFRSAGVFSIIAMVREDDCANYLFLQCGFRNSGLRKVDMLRSPMEEPEKQ